MNEQRIQDAASYFTRPWSKRRGIETIDRNAEVILVKASLDGLSAVLAAQAIESRQNVVGSQIEIQGAFVLAYQLVGQSWSIMVEGYVPAYGSPSVFHSSQLAQLSKHLNQPIIRLLVSDTGSHIGYDLYEHGALVEYFRGTEENDTRDSNGYGIQPQHYLVTSRPSAEAIAKLNLVMKDINPDSLVSEQTAYFWSRRRQVTAGEIGNIWQFPNQLLLDYDAYDPALGDRYFLGGYSTLRQGDRYRVQNQGITMSLRYDREGRKREVTSVPDLVRVDYFRLRN
ncbi:MAG: hypothetical protein H7Z11_07350 [Verrucomicrobia bacterium]|nr:hypothetical protein [Leptolyngbya sp. ES-bin-22]